MSKIIPKLDLNKTPQLVENNSLIMAKNIRLLEDGSIGPDTSLEEIEVETASETGVEYINYVNPVMNTETYYKYTILDPDTVISHVKNGNEITNTLEDSSFNFATYNPNYNEESERIDFRELRIVEESSDNNCNVYCYSLDNEKIKLIFDSFKYNPEFNTLVDKNGCCLFIALREDFYNENLNLEVDIPYYYYIILPNNYNNSNIYVGEYLYYVLNPIYAEQDYRQIVVKEGYWNTRSKYDGAEYVGQIVGLDNKIYFFKECLYVKVTQNSIPIILGEYPGETFDFLPSTGDEDPTLSEDINGYLTRNGILVKNKRLASIIEKDLNKRIKIFEYDEVNKTFTIVNCGWIYNGGKITGAVTVNNTGEYILTICEYDNPSGFLIPIKHINLSKCSSNDDESIYTQAPNIPISNIHSVRKYNKSIPAGVYQFFIRYKIRDNFYTNWFPCSKELFAGTRKNIETLQGSLKYIDHHEDSDKSFVFKIEHLYPNYLKLYEKFQLGFIISSEQGTVARAWKHFDTNVGNNPNKEYFFDYNKQDIEEINIDDLLKVNYNIFNVKNVAHFKNKLYIANYQETNFDEDLEGYAKNSNVCFRLKELDNNDYEYYFDGQGLNHSAVVGQDFYFSFGERGAGETYIRDVILDSKYFNINDRLDYWTTDRYYPEEEFNLVLEADPHYFDSYLENVTITYNNEVYYIIPDAVEPEDREYLDNFNNDSDILDVVLDRIKEKIEGIKEDGTLVFNINGVIIESNTFKINYVVVNVGDKFIDDSYYEDIYVYDIFETHYALTKTITLKENIIKSVGSYDHKEYNTLLPFTTYDFYIHYVKQNGIATNGYFIGSKTINRYCRGYKEIDNPGDVPMKDLYHVDIDDLLIYDKDIEEYGTATYQGVTHYYHLEEIDNSKHYIIYPEFDISVPPGYVACFITVYKHDNNVCQCFNLEQIDAYYRAECLELDSLLYNRVSNIELRNSKGELITQNARYISSGNVEHPENIGCCGHLDFKSNITITNSDIVWITNTDIPKPTNSILEKITPYIKITYQQGNIIKYFNYLEANSPGYYCEISKLNKQYCDFGYQDSNNNDTGYYVSGSDVYIRKLSGNILTLEEVNNKLEHHSSLVNYVFSNFNLNYLSLQEDLNLTIRDYVETVTENNVTTEVTKHQYINLVNSLTCSFILTLKSFYKEYIKKIYTAYNKKSITKFDNTIRCSNIDVDEVYRDIYRFESTDYYNVPTNRGIITNLISIVNSIYVHCEHSLFKFTDNKTLNANEEEVTLQENDIFNSGISEVFDAQYGYAGLADRNQSLVTFNAYVFYDSVAKIIYAFGGNQQISNISNSIKKLINYVNPTDVRFVGDEIHNRFFVNLINDKGNVCLSFNLTNNSFVSIHDISFEFGFHTRSNTYFVHNNTYNGTLLGWSIYKIIDSLTVYRRQDNQDPNNTTHTYFNYYVAYQTCYKQSLINIFDCDNQILNEYNCANSCIDVIVNTQYEAIKVLNYLSWICSEIKTYTNTNDNVAEENIDRQYPGTKIRVYTDTTKTHLIDLLDINGNPKISNDERNRDSFGNITANDKTWQYIRYNCGIWSMNYFRDIQNINDIFEYMDSENGLIGEIGYEGTSETTNLIPNPVRQNLTQENSLLYGKYFVVRFIFNNKNFKLENIILKMDDYGKTK